jgi:ankyrin repeat protein
MEPVAEGEPWSEGDLEEEDEDEEEEEEEEGEEDEEEDEDEDEDDDEEEEEDDEDGGNDLRDIVLAAAKGYLPDVRRLLQQKPWLLDAIYMDATPLMAAAAAGQLEVMGYLLGQGAQVNLRTRLDNRSDDLTALDWACQAGHVNAVSLLIANGADPGAAGLEGGTPLMIASSKGKTDVVSLLLAHDCGDIDHQDVQAWTALHYGSCRSEVPVAKALLWAGADPHLTSRRGERPLDVALGRSRAAPVAALLKASA